MRCFACNNKLNDIEFNMCRDICGVCQEAIDDALSDTNGYEDREFLLEGTGVPYLDDGESLPYYDLDFYDNLEYFDEDTDYQS